MTIQELREAIQAALYCADIAKSNGRDQLAAAFESMAWDFRRLLCEVR